MAEDGVDDADALLALLNDHLEATGHEMGTDPDLGAWCETCAIREAEGG